MSGAAQGWAVFNRDTNAICAGPFASKTEAEENAQENDYVRPVKPGPGAEDQTFCLGQGEHYALVGGRVFGPWPDKGTAAAGLATEQRRATKRRPRWCAWCGEIHPPGEKECNPGVLSLGRDGLPGGQS